MGRPLLALTVTASTMMAEMEFERQGQMSHSCCGKEFDSKAFNVSGSHPSKVATGGAAGFVQRSHPSNIATRYAAISGCL